MAITLKFICREIEKQSYEMSLHADDERLDDELTVLQLEYALLNGTILETYPDDPRGESCLVLGFTPEGTPVHIVCGRKSAGHLFIITVYIPTMPKWRSPESRNR
jgi:hypothetical protein